MTSVALLTWPILALIVFARLPLAAAITVATLLPYLYLPEVASIRLPSLPNLDKTNVIAVGLVLGMVAFGRRRALEDPLLGPGRIIVPVRRLMSGCILVFILGACVTVLNNRESLTFGPTVLPAMRVWDVISVLGGLGLGLVPFWLAQRYLAASDRHRTVLKALVWGGLAYSLLMLVEKVMSPQLHRWVYGFHQHDFIQHIRDGYRPMVFLQHGLWVGFFMLQSTMAAFALWKGGQGRNWLLAGVWLFAILGISENLGAAAICIVILGLLLFARRGAQLAFVMVMAGAMLAYPALRQAQLIPLDRILAMAESVSSERAGSLEFRLDNEDLLLERAQLKPLTGWGSWGRDRIYDSEGRSVAISEGRWIQVLGAWGWVGYVGLFGLLTLPLFWLRRAGRRKDVPPETMVLALICAGNLIYMIPNSTLTPVSWLLFGALAGFVQRDFAAAPDRTPAAVTRGRSRYTRFPRPDGPRPA